MTYHQDIDINVTQNININVTARVVLTEHGAKAINQYNKGYHISGDEEHDERYFPTNHREGDEIEKPLWELMAIFGPHITHGGPIVFMSNNITLVNTL